MSTRNFSGRRFEDGREKIVSDRLTEEAALQITVNGMAYTTTMRTPGDDEDLVRGLLFSEGIVTDPRAPLSMRAIEDPESGHWACMEVSTPEKYVLKDVERIRSALATSSCGVCGTRELRDLQLEGPPLDSRKESILEIGLTFRMLKTMEENQTAFDESGGSHCAAAFTVDAELLSSYEDVGRHNAVDKVIGALIRKGLLKEAECLLVSGRVSYEIVFKAYRGGMPYVLAVSAPSTLAVETAEQFGITLVAFCRDGRATVYSNADNVGSGGTTISGRATR